jgi:hypothetical protein
MPRSQNKERTQKTSRVKYQIIYKGKSIRITVDLSVEIIKARRMRENLSNYPSDRRLTEYLKASNN